MRLAGGQGEEGRDRLRVPVDVELEPRLPHALDQRQRGRRRLEPDPQPLRAAQPALVEARALHLAQLVRHLGGERQPQPPAALLGDRRQLVGQLAGDRLEHEAPAAEQLAGAHAPDPPGDRLGQPGMDVGVDLQPAVALDHALDVGRRAVGLQRPPLLAVPVEAAAGDAAHGVDDLAHVGKREDHGLVAVAVAAELDVVDGIRFAHHTEARRRSVRSAADGPAPLPRAAPRPRPAAADARRLPRPPAVRDEHPRRDPAAARCGLRLRGGRGRHRGLGAERRPRRPGHGPRDRPRRADEGAAHRRGLHGDQRHRVRGRGAGGRRRDAGDDPRVPDGADRAAGLPVAARAAAEHRRPRAARHRVRARRAPARARVHHRPAARRGPRDGDLARGGVPDRRRAPGGGRARRRRLAPTRGPGGRRRASPARGGRARSRPRGSACSCSPSG